MALRGVVPGLDGLALFLFVVPVSVDRVPVAVSFGLALLSSAAVATVLLLVRRRGPVAT